MRVRYQKKAGHGDSSPDPQTMNCGHLHLTSLAASRCSRNSFRYIRCLVWSTTDEGLTWLRPPQEEREEPGGGGETGRQLEKRTGSHESEVPEDSRPAE